MSADTSTTRRPARRKRERRVVENSEFDAFARRIVRAYARRVASGDIEALAALRQLASTVETATADAVQGLRSFGYSWADVAARLGVSRQAAQMRWGAHPTDCGRLDPRLLKDGLGVTVATLVAVFLDHHPGTPAASACPGCEFRYPPGALDCPSNTVVRPLLRRRRHEDRSALDRLNADQLAELHDHRRFTRAAAAERTVSAQPVDSVQPLFDQDQKGVRL
jgi:hypothetical protein